MFVGHYGRSFAIRAVRPEIPLWVLFVAAQLVDIAWTLLVLAGIEKLRVVPGFTAANPLDLYYMPYTHSLVAAVLWALAAAIVCRWVFRWRGWVVAAWVGVAVLSHWVLDLLVHRPDLPLYGNSAKVGLGLWNFLGISLAAFMLLMQVASIVGPPPPSPQVVAMSGFGAYLMFAALAAWIDRGRRPIAAANLELR